MERGTIYNQIDICCLDRYKTSLKKAHAQYNADNQSFARQLILFVRLLAVIYASIARERAQFHAKSEYFGTPKSFL